MREQKGHRSILKWVGVMVIVALAAVTVSEVATAHLVRYQSSVTLRFRVADNTLLGRVTSPNARCERGRTVVVFRVVASAPDQRIGSARTNFAGRWHLLHNAQASDYYARVLKRDIGPGAHRHICKADASPIITIPPRCGNGFIEAGEPCDDGNTTNGDGCDSTCQVESPPVCGNGIIESGEACDDGNTTNGDGCDADCQVESALVARLAARELEIGSYKRCPVLRPATAPETRSRLSVPL